MAKHKGIKSKFADTLTQERNQIYGTLRGIIPEINFDPHSTFGKFVVEEVKDIVQIYQRHLLEVAYTESAIEKKNSRAETAKNKRSIIIENRRLEAREVELQRLFKERCPIIAKASQNIFITVFMLSLFSLFIVPSPYVFVLCFMLLMIVLPLLLKKYKEKFIINVVSIANYNISKINFESDLIEKEKRILQEIKILKQKILTSHGKMQDLKPKIKEKTFILLNNELVSFVLSDKFYKSSDWQYVRKQVLDYEINECVHCGSVKDLTVDHILPRSKYPLKALLVSNAQILCRSCNSSKGNR